MTRTASIPYTYDVRPDTGVSNVALGVWLFLASEVMLFGGLFSAYFMLRAGAAAWGGTGAHLGLAIVNTILLLGAGAALGVALSDVRRGETRRSRLWVGLAIVLALAFLGVKGAEYADDIRQGWYPRTSTRWALYFLLTGVHALHVVGGILVNLRLAVARPAPGPDAGRARVARTRAALLYWSFVDAVWIALFVMLYVT